MARPKITFDRFVEDLFIVCSDGRFAFGADINWIARKKLDLGVLDIPHDWPELAAAHLQMRGLGNHYNAKDGSIRFQINKAGIVEGIRLRDAKMSSRFNLSAGAWSAILTAVGIIVSILAIYL